MVLGREFLREIVRKGMWRRECKGEDMEERVRGREFGVRRGVL